MPILAVIPFVPIILALGAVGIVLLLIWGPLQEKKRLMEMKEGCDALRTKLAIHRTQGGSVDEAQRLQAQLTDCQDKLRDLGVDVPSEAEELMRQIETQREQIRQEFSHLKSTDYSDILKRGSTRGTILRLGEGLPNLYQAGIASAEGVEEPEERLEQLQTLLEGLRIDINDSKARGLCYAKEMQGCGRYFGSTEDDSGSKSRAELNRIRKPLEAVEEQLLEAIHGADYKERSEYVEAHKSDFLGFGGIGADA